MTAIPDIEGLIERVKATTGPDRELDAALIDLACETAVKLGVWKLAKIGSDYDGENACEIYTRDGKLVPDFAYPPRGKIHPYFHVRSTITPWGARSFRDNTETALAFLNVVLPGAFWMLGKGRVNAVEKLYGFQIMFGTDEVIADGEANNAADAIILAALTALHSQEPGDTR